MTEWIRFSLLFGAAAYAASAQQPLSFADKLYPVFQKAGCRMCHNPEGVASATRLRFPEEGAANERLAVFGHSLVELIDRQHPDDSILLNKATNRTMHSGGESIKKGSEDEVVLKQWIGYLATLSDSDLPPAPRAQSRWRLASDGGITWDVAENDVHQDRIEMSGKKVSTIVTYGVRENSSLVLTLRLAFPSLRTVPNDKSATLSYIFEDDAPPRFSFGGKPAPAEKVTRFHHRGVLNIDSVFGKQGDITLARTIFPSMESLLVLENLTFTNHSSQETSIEVESTQKIVRTEPARGVTGAYIISARVLPGGAKRVAPGNSVSFGVAFSGREANSDELTVDWNAEETARRSRVESFLSELQLETPDPWLNTAFAFAKIRAAESIYLTKGGLMHGSGGGGYATIWANDQIEYANPFFPFLGDAAANQASINALRLFARYMNPDYQPLPNAVVAEGTGSWKGPGDRGDMAMIAYGAARFALAYGDRDTGRELWKLIVWSLE